MAIERREDYTAAQDHGNVETKPALTTTTHTTAQTSFLLNLPGELRNRIYSLVLPTSSEIYIESARQTDARIRYRFSPCPPLFAICRELSAEAAALYYATNTFVFSNISIGERALRVYASLRPAGTEHLRRVKVTHFISLPQVAPAWMSRHLDAGVWEYLVSFYIRFVAWVSSGGGSSSEAKVRVSEVCAEFICERRTKVYDEGEEDGLCLRAVLSMAEEAAPGPGALTTLLGRYAEVVGAHRAVMSRAFGSGRSGEIVGAKICLLCRKVKAF